jgi:hypothetical protein
MTLRTVSNEVIHLMEDDNFDQKRRLPILAILEKFLTSKHYITIISVAIKNQKRDDVISIATIPKLINIIVSCMSLVDLSNTLKTSDMKYFIYGVLYSFITTEDAGFFSDISIETFERMYDGIFDILMMAPTAIEVGSSVCNILCA